MGSNKNDQKLTHDYGCIYYFMSDCIDDENPENAFLKVSESFSQFINNMC